LVEHATENRSVGGSIPPLGTISSNEFKTIDLFSLNDFRCRHPGVSFWVTPEHLGIPWASFVELGEELLADATTNSYLKSIQDDATTSGRCVMQRAHEGLPAKER
jgi:hypothetical protein